MSTKANDVKAEKLLIENASHSSLRVQSKQFRDL